MLLYSRYEPLNIDGQSRCSVNEQNPALTSAGQCVMQPDHWIGLDDKVQAVFEIAYPSDLKSNFADLTAADAL